MHTETRDSPPPSATAPLRLLVADDNPASRMIAAGLAEKLGHEADVAADGEQALRMFMPGRYHLVLMDCEMPRLDGYDACRRLRVLEGDGRRTPVVALSAARGEDARLACLEAGMDDFLCKPLSLHELEQVLARWRPSARPEGKAEENPADGLESVARHFGNRYPELAALWLNDIPVRLAALRAAITGGDRVNAARIAHALGGGCASIGAARLSLQCRQLELDLGGGMAGDPYELLAWIEAGCAEVALRVNALLQSSGQS